MERNLKYRRQNNWHGAPDSPVEKSLYWIFSVRYGPQATAAASSSTVWPLMVVSLLKLPLGVNVNFLILRFSCLASAASPYLPYMESTSCRAVRGCGGEMEQSHQICKNFSTSGYSSVFLHHTSFQPWEEEKKSLKHQMSLSKRK